MLQAETSELMEDSSPFVPIPTHCPSLNQGFCSTALGGGLEQKGWGRAASTCSCNVGLHSILAGGSMVTVPPAAIVLPALLRDTESCASLFYGGSSGGGGGGHADGPLLG